MRRLIATIPDAGERPTDLARALDLDYALAWQIHALAGQPELHMTARVVPKTGSMERFLTAAHRLAPAEAAEEARAAYQAFEVVVSELSGDRQAFDAMVTLQRPDDGAGLRRARRTAHRANAAVWGVTCKAKVQTAVFRMRPTGEFDSLVVLGYVGLQRLHADAIVSTLASTRTWGGTSGPPEGGPQATISCSLIEEACTKPLPRIEHAPGPDGLRQEFLALDGLGKRSEATVFWRSAALNVPGANLDPPHNLTSTCRVPTELLVLQLLLPRGTILDPEVMVWVAPAPDRYVETDPNSRHRFPFEGSGRHHGTALSALHTVVSPGHADLMQSEIARLGWEATEFDIYRCEVQYPILHTAVHLRVTERD